MPQVKSDPVFETLPPLPPKQSGTQTTSQSAAADNLQQAPSDVRVTLSGQPPAQRPNTALSLLSDDARQRLDAVFSAHAAIQPIPLVNHAPQTPARKGQIFELQQHSNEDYYLLPTCAENPTLPPVNGVFLYAILANDPTRIMVGAPYGSITVDNDTFGIQGHTSITDRQDVLYAGEMRFEHGKLTLWTNNSGHYAPAAELRHSNLLPAIKKLLPDTLFSDTRGGPIKTRQALEMLQMRGYLNVDIEDATQQHDPDNRRPGLTYDADAFRAAGQEAGAGIHQFGTRNTSPLPSDNGLLLAHAIALQNSPSENYLQSSAAVSRFPEMSELHHDMGNRHRSTITDRFAALQQPSNAPAGSDTSNISDSLKQWAYQQHLERLGTQLGQLPSSSQLLRDLPAYLAAQTDTTHLLLNTPQGRTSIWVDNSGNTPQFGLIDPAFGVVNGIPNRAAFAKLLFWHFYDSYTSDNRITVHTLTKEVAASLAANHAANELPGDKIYSARDLLVLQDRRDGLLRIGSQEIARATLHDMGAMLNRQPLTPDSLLHTGTANLGQHLQFDDVTLQQHIQTPGNTADVSDLLYDMSSSRSTPEPMIITQQDQPRPWVEPLNTVLTRAAEVGSRINTDAPGRRPINVFTYMLPGGGAVRHTGVGLQAFDIYNSIRDIRNAIVRGDNTEVAISGANLLAEALSAGAEKGIATLGSYLQKGNVARFNAFAKTSIGSKLGGVKTLSTNIGRAASGVGVLITTPFDIYSAYRSFSQAAASTGKAAQDHYVNGTLAVTGAASSIALATAAFAGVAAAGPVGIAVGLTLAVAGGIYSSVRYVEDLDTHANLDGWEKFITGVASFVGSGASQEIEDRAAISKGKENYTAAQNNFLRNFLSQYKEYGIAIFGDAIVTAQSPHIETAPLRQGPYAHHSENIGRRNHTVTQRPAHSSNAGNDNIDARDGTEHVTNLVTAALDNGNGNAVYWSPGDGDDILHGVTDRSNTFAIGNGRKNIEGGNLHDHFRITAGLTATSTLHGGNGNDTLNLYAATANRTSTFNVILENYNFPRSVLRDGEFHSAPNRHVGPGHLDTVSNGSSQKQVTLTSIENVVTAKNGCTDITGNDKNNLFILNGHNDSVDGGGGDDIYVVNGGGTVQIAAGSGNNRYQFARSIDTVNIAQASQTGTTELNLDWQIGDITMQAVDDNLDIFLGADRQQKISLQDMFQTNGMGQMEAAKPDGKLSILTADGYLLTPLLSSIPQAEDGLIQVVASISPHHMTALAA